MRRRILISLIALPVWLGAQPVKADPTPAIFATMTRFLDLCGPVMADPAAYVDGLSSRYREGTYGIVTTPDGQHLKVNASADGGKFFDTYSRTLIVDRGNEGCGTYATGTIKGSAPDIAAIVEAHFTSTYGTASFTGGYFPELYSEWGDTSDKLITNPNSYSYVVAGMFADKELDTFVHVANDFLSFTTSLFFPNFKQG